jgi:hypothetical protein
MPAFVDFAAKVLGLDEPTTRTMVANFEQDKKMKTMFPK